MRGPHRLGGRDDETAEEDQEDQEDQEVPEEEMVTTETEEETA